DRVLLEERRVRTEVRHDDHVGRVAHDEPGVAVVGVIVLGAMGKHDVRFPLANEAHDLAPRLEVRHELAVVDVEDLGLDPEDARGLLHLARASLGERAAGLVPVPDVAVRERDELHVMARFRPERRDTADLDLAVIGMRAERDDPEFAVIGPRRRDGIPGRDLLSHDARNLRWHERHDARAAGDEPTYEYEHATARHGIALPANGSDPGVAS